MRVCTWSLHTKTGIETIDRVQRSASQFVSGENLSTSGQTSMYANQTLNSNDYSVRRRHGLVSSHNRCLHQMKAQIQTRSLLHDSLLLVMLCIFHPTEKLTQESVTAVTAEVLHRVALTFIDIVKACFCSQ